MAVLFKIGIKVNSFKCIKPDHFNIFTIGTFKDTSTSTNTSHTIALFSHFLFCYDNLENLKNMDFVNNFAYDWKNISQILV